MTGTGLGVQQDQVKRHWNYDVLYFGGRAKQTLFVHKMTCSKNIRMHVLNTDSSASGTRERGIRKYRQIQLFNI